MITKICTACKRQKEYTLFSLTHYKAKRLGSKKLGYSAECKSCLAERAKRYRLINKDKIVAYRQEPRIKEAGRERQRRKSDRCRRMVHELLWQSICTDCGTNDFLVLQFDHISANKVMNIAEAINYNIDTLQQEIDKCEVVCANCHLKRTEKRRGTSSRQRFIESKLRVNTT